jgi:drug/metabolite transporter (DMT)-like permease
VSVTPVDLRVALATGRGFPDGSLPRYLAAIGSGIGSVVLIGGALWSAWVFLRRRHNGRRALSNVIIALGVLIVAYGGTATFTGASDILESANLVGVSVMFLGFLLA